MYEPGFEPPVVEDNGLIQPNFVLLSGPWPETASSGAVEPGESFTITYSFVPDGTIIPGTGANEQDAPSNLFATMDANFPGGRFAWQSVFHQVFARYGEMTNINFVFVPDDGASFGISFPFGIPSRDHRGNRRRGDMRISMRPIGAGPLARNYAPTFGGDMTMDSLDVNQFSDPTNNFRKLRNVLFHEIGHGLGLDHVLPQNATKLMEPVLNTAFDGPQEDDLRAIHYLYGDRFESNENGNDYKFLGLQLQHPSVNGTQTLVVEDLAAEREDSEDWYGVTVAGSIDGLPGVAIRVEPVGTQYQYSPDEDGARCKPLMRRLPVISSLNCIDVSLPAR
ncbi:MAG: matrixin family metalloprotease [Phycisphaerae bacterium]